MIKRVNPVMAVCITLILVIVLTPIFLAKSSIDDSFTYRYIYDGKNVAKLPSTSGELLVLADLAFRLGGSISGLKTSDSRYTKYNNLNITYDMKLPEENFIYAHPYNTGELVYMPSGGFSRNLDKWIEKGGFGFSYGFYTDINRDYYISYHNTDVAMSTQALYILNLETFIETLPYMDVNTSLVSLTPDAVTNKYIRLLDREASKLGLSRQQYAKKVVANKSMQVELLDAGKSDWARSEISQSIKGGLIPSNELRNFYLNDLTRDQMAYLMIRWYELYNNEEETDFWFSYRKTISSEEAGEIIQSHPITDAVYYGMYPLHIYKAYELGFVKGVETIGPRAKYDPMKVTTRQEFCTTLYRMLKEMDPEISPRVTRINASDVSNIDSWAKEAVQYCYEKGIIKGTDDNRIAPKENITVEQAIAIMNRLAVERNVY